MHQNIPNPYIDITSIPFELIYKSDVKLSVFDLEGKVVYDVNLQNLQAGKQQIEFNPKNLGLPHSN